MERVKSTMAREDDLKRDLMYLYKDLADYLLGLFSSRSFDGIESVSRQQLVRDGISKRQRKIANREGLIDKLWEEE